MRATIVSEYRCATVYPALADSKGQIITAPFNTFDQRLALDYAELAAKLNPHDDRNRLENRAGCANQGQLNSTKQ